jgi:hypothetical protein
VADIELINPDELKEQREDRFTKRVALTTALFAVMLAITSLGGNNAMKELLLTQQQSSNQWAFYQSKVMREHIYKVQKMNEQGLLLERASTMKPEVKGYHEKLLLQMSQEEQRYGSEKKEIEQSAKKLEQQRDVAMSRDPYFDYAEVLLQIAIVLASISILAGSRPVFGISLACAGIGSVLCMNGYLLIFRIPFFH